VDSTRFAVFRPNGPALWATLDAVCTTKLESMAQLGQLAGATPNDAFFVTCDASNNPPDTVANGEVHITVGVALASPAEFVIIEIGQYAGTSTVTNSLTTSITQAV
jgi:phage tail sheath protein FI